MEDEIVGDLDEHAIAQQERDDLLRARFVDGQLGEDVFQIRHFEAGTGERVFNLLLGFGFFVFHHDAAAGEARLLARNFQLLSFCEQVEKSGEDFRAKPEFFAKLLFTDSGDKRICILKLLKCGEEGFAYLSGGRLRDEKFVETQNAQLGRRFRRDESCRRGSYERWRPSGFGEGVDEAEAVSTVAGDAGSEDLLVSAFGKKL